MAKKLSSAFRLFVCVSLLCEAQGQNAEPAPIIIVRRLEAVKLLDEKRQPVEIEAKITLQTQGKAVYALTVFYRNSPGAPFQEAPCELLPFSLKYYVRLTYSPLTEYYFVATQFAGGKIRFGEGTLAGPDLEPYRRTRFDPVTGYVGAATAGILALATSALVNSDQPAKVGSRQNGPALYIGIGAAVGGVPAAIVYLRNRHKRHKKRVGPDSR